MLINGVWWCDFCDKSDRQTSHIVARQEKHNPAICHECLVLAGTVLNEDLAPEIEYQSWFQPTASEGRG